MVVPCHQSVFEGGAVDLEGIFRTYVECRCFHAELGEGVPQSLLGDGELSELSGQRLSQLGHVIVALSVVFEQLEARLQVQIHRTGSTAQLLRQRLPGTLRGEMSLLIRHMFIDQTSITWVSLLPPCIC